MAEVLTTSLNGGDRSSVRCAIYTRKSTEEGLEQEFNSLMAQREAAEAYIASQRSQHWTALPDNYDDGGFSGGNMDRPGLRRLLDDVERGRIDCVVVYKVDRLSRSLLDFARIIGVLDKHGVSFVSVTQQFNTSAPLGRLTLHILLSFAQFEREIIGERTRDKIQASWKKGLWTGGYVPFGYDLDTGAGGLVVNDAEAARVREIFRIFMETRSLIGTVREINLRGWTTKSWTTRKGKQRTGGPFRWPALRCLLTNSLYAGLIRHQRQELVPGQQPAIVEPEMFHHVGQILSRQERGPSGRIRQKQEGWLKGLAYCSCGAAMVLTYTKRPNAAVRYYACGSRRRKGAQMCAARAISADQIEAAVLGQIHEYSDEFGVRRDSVDAAVAADVIERVSYDSSSGRLEVRLKERRSAPGPAAGE